MRAAGTGLLAVRPEHEAVDRQRVFSGVEQLGQLDRAALALEAIILRDGAAGRQGAAPRGDTLDPAAQGHLLLEQGISRLAVAGAFAGKTQMMDARR